MASVRAGSATDPGRTGRNNEDNFVVTDRLFVVADGMGGHAAGEVASQIAVDRMAGLVGTGAVPSALDVVEAIRAANGDIFRAAIANPEQAGMGTTITAVGVITDAFSSRAVRHAEVDPRASDAERLAHAATTDADGTRSATDDGTGSGIDTGSDATGSAVDQADEALVIANVGDSRTYLFRHGRLRRVTVDHNYVQELVATGHITEDEARTHPRRNIITRTLGIEPDVKVDWWTLPLIRGDRFVLCSDGLVDEVPDRDIAATVAAVSDPQSCAERLVEQANEAGGRDNITVIVLDILDGDDPPDPTQEIDVVPIWPDPATAPTSAGPLELDAESPAGASPDTDTPAESLRAGRRRNLKRFAVGLAAMAVVVVGFVVVSAWARNGYFVAFDDDDQAIIFQGRPGGVLWIDPTAKNQTGPTRDELEPEIAARIDDKPRFDSFSEAAEFIRDGVTTTTTTTTTSTTTTTTTTTTTIPGDATDGP